MLRSIYVISVEKRPIELTTHGYIGKKYLRNEDTPTIIEYRVEFKNGKIAEFADVVYTPIDSFYDAEKWVKEYWNDV